MLLVASRGLLLLLLALDWVEDPHFGTNIFTLPLSSTPVSSLDLGFEVAGPSNFHASVKNEVTPAIAEFGFRVSACLLNHEVELHIFNCSDDCLYRFMSLQQ
jgi:hypothetical protein